MCLALWVACAVGGLANPPTPEVPRVLVDAPIAARIAANDAAHWKQLGAAGFLFRGIYDAIDAAPQGGLQDLGPATPESALLKELRLSVDELAKAGLDHNYLRVSLAPDAAWFSDRDDARRGIDFLEGAGIFCARAGLRGLALDMRPGAPIYRYDWKGHGAEPSSVRLEEGAREFGRRGMRAFIRAMPNADLMFIADDLENAGPLWFSFFEGIVESVGAAESLRLDLAVRFPRDAVRADDVMRHLEAIESRICDALPEDARRTWQLQGGYVPILEPLEVKDGTVQARVPLAAFRESVAGAKLAASDFVAIRGDYGTWWPLSDKAARGYSKLKQRGDAAARATPTPLEGADQWDFNTPFDAFERVGPLREKPGAPYVFRDGVRSAVLFWEAPPAAIEADAEVAAALVTPLATHAEKTSPVSDKKLTLEAESLPAVVRGLPLNAWAAPASVWCAFDAAPAVGPGRVPLRLGVRNVYPGDLDASIVIETPGDLSLGVKEIPIFLKPGGAVAFEKALQGTFALGDTASLKLALKSPLSPGVARSFRKAAHLRTEWRQRRDGPVSTPPLLLGSDTDTVIVTASEAGDVAGYATDGTLIWQRRFAPPVVLNAWPGRGANGATLVAMGDALGTIHVLEARGKAVWKGNAGAGISELLFADVFAIEHDALLARTTKNELLCLGDGGQIEWRYAPGAAMLIGTPARARRLAPASHAPEDKLYIATTGDTPSLIRLGGHGQMLWTRELKAAPQLPPVIVSGLAGDTGRALVPIAGGELCVFSGDIGAEAASVTPLTAGSGRWTFLESAPNDGNLLAAREMDVSMLDHTLKPMWNRGLTHPLGATIVNGGWLVLGGEQITFLAHDGTVKWQDAPPYRLHALASTALPGGAQGTWKVIGGSGRNAIYSILLP